MSGFSDNATLAGVAVVGGLVNMGCDLALAPGWGPGSATAGPDAVAALLAQVPMARLVIAAVLGALAISSWTLATPALVSLVRPAGRWLAGAIGLLHVWLIGGCVAFHVVFCCTVWGVGDDLKLLEPMWMALGGTMAVLFLTFFLALVVAVLRNVGVPRWLPLVSPLVVMTGVPMMASVIPAPLGLPIALMASTAGAVVWLIAVWRCALNQSRAAPV